MWPRRGNREGESSGLWPLVGGHKRLGEALPTHSLRKRTFLCDIGLLQSAVDIGIGAGDEATTPVTPTGDSHVEIEWTEPTGKRARQTAGCYFGPGFSGRIEVHVADGKIRAIVDDTDI